MPISNPAGAAGLTLVTAKQNLSVTQAVFDAPPEDLSRALESNHIPIADQNDLQARPRGAAPSRGTRAFGATNPAKG